MHMIDEKTRQNHLVNHSSSPKAAIIKQLYGFFFLFFFLAFGGGCADGRAKIQVTNNQAVRKAFVDYLSNHGTEVGTKSASDYDIELKPFRQSTWLVYAAYKRDPLGRTPIYLVSEDGIRKATLKNLVYAHAREFPVSSDGKVHREIIESIIEISSSDGFRPPATIISSTRDIPGYDEVKKGRHGNRVGGPLDADLQSVIRPSWKDEWPTSGNLFYVVYTYKTLGGVVSRYKFQFCASSRDENMKFNQWRICNVEHLVLGKSVGDFSALE